MLPVNRRQFVLGSTAALALAGLSRGSFGQPAGMLRAACDPGCLEHARCAGRDARRCLRLEWSHRASG